MKFLPVFSAFIAAVAAQGDDPDTPDDNQTQQIAFASYIGPGQTDVWNRLISYNTTKLTTLIANVNNGPDSEVNDQWKNVIDKANATGKRVLGYVRTGYLGLSASHYTTRLGSLDLADWTSQIEHDVDSWYQLYGNSIGGIFFDEGHNQCGTSNAGEQNLYADLYTYINNYTKRKYPGAFTVLNPGGTLPQCYENTMDTLLTWETALDAYDNNYVANIWMPKDPRKIWHIVYNVTQSDVKRVTALARQRGAGLLELTDDKGANPYDELPSDDYMKLLLGGVEGDTPPIELPSDVPDGPDAGVASALTVTSFEYSSVSLKWDAAPNALGYRVYLNKTLILDLTKQMTHVTVGGLTPGSSGLSFTVRAVGGGGEESLDSNTVTASTKALPGGSAVTNVKATVSGDSTTYTADVLLAYSDIRIFIWTGDSDDAKKYPNWPINYNAGSFVCNRYQIAGSDLLKYNGTIPQGNAYVDYVFPRVGGAVFSKSGYTYSWTIKNSDVPFDTTKFLVFNQGYGPKVNFFTPCPKMNGGPDPNYVPHAYC